MRNEDAPTPKLSLRPAIFALAAFSVVSNILLLISPLFLTQVYDRVLPSRSNETLLYLTVIAISGLMLFGLIESIRQTLAQKLSASYELSVLPRLIGAASEGAGSAVAAASSKASIVKRFLASGAYINLFDIPFAPLFLGLMFLANPVLGWITLAGMTLLVIVAVLNQVLAGRDADRNAAAQAMAGRFAGDAMRQMEDVRALGMGPGMVRRWQNVALGAAVMGDRIGGINARFFGLVRFTRQTIQIVVLGAGAWLVIRGSMNPSLIFAASIVSSRALLPVEQLVGAWRQISEARRARREIAEALALVATRPGETAKLSLPEPKGLLQASKLTYAVGVSLDAPVLVKDAELTVQPCEIAVIVGPSGSGKSTFARLLSGALTPSSGDVRLDGFRLDQWPVDQRGRNFGYMAQQSILLEGTIAENIARFTPGALDEDIVAAAQAAQAHAFIATLPDGYNTRAGTGGIRLSGGQIQRIALARALFRSPAVLILDEPNAHLDSAGEDALMQVLAAERDRGAAIVVVTHRANILTIADVVYLMDGGRLARIANPHAKSPDNRQVLPMTAASKQRDPGTAA